MKIRKLISLIMCLCLLSSFASTFAADQQQPPQSGFDRQQAPQGVPGGGFDPLTGWKKLLEDEIIDEDTYNAVEEYLSSKTYEEGEQPEFAEGEIPQMPQGGEMPEMPQGGEMPQMPQGGEMPQMPQGGEIPQMPQGSEMPQMPQGGEMPQMPEGEEMTGYPGISPEIVDELLENDVINEDVYAAVLAVIEVPEQSEN